MINLGRWTRLVREGKTLDLWTVLHFTVPFLVGLVLLQLGVPFVILVLGVIGWEVAEQKALGRTVFGWSHRGETPLNILADVFAGTIGVWLAQVLLTLS